MGLELYGRAFLLISVWLESVARKRVLEINHTQNLMDKDVDIMGWKPGTLW